MGISVSTRARRLLYAIVAAAIALIPVVNFSSETAPRILADCNDVVDTTDSFSMNCAPTMIPDTSDQLTEAEVAEPGWNAHPGGGR